MVDVYCRHLCQQPQQQHTNMTPLILSPHCLPPHLYSLCAANYLVRALLHVFLVMRFFLFAFILLYFVWNAIACCRIYHRRNLITGTAQGEMNAFSAYQQKTSLFFFLFISFTFIVSALFRSANIVPPNRFLILIVCDDDVDFLMLP